MSSNFFYLFNVVENICYNVLCYTTHGVCFCAASLFICKNACWSNC